MAIFNIPVICLAILLASMATNTSHRPVRPGGQTDLPAFLLVLCTGPLLLAVAVAIGIGTGNRRGQVCEGGDRQQ